MAAAAAAKAMTHHSLGWTGFALGALLLPFAAGAQAVRLAPLAAMAMRQQESAPVLGVLRQKGMLRPAAGNQPAMASTLVRFSGPVPPQVSAIGGHVQWRTGDVAAVDVPLGSLRSLSQLAGVTYVDLAMPLQPQLDVAVPATGASVIRSGTPPDWHGDTGRNVIVATIDTGIDLVHRDFRDAAGNTRILHLFDYTTGQQCTQAQIDAQQCAEVDTDGHGTEVAGIAAGNGSATGNGEAAYQFVGMAPEASLIVAKGDWTTANIVQAIGDVEGVATSRGCPTVVNLSLGTEIGPHDGTDNAARALDNESGPGRIIVVAAGNHANDADHASATVPAGGSLFADMAIPVDTSLTLIDIWYPGSDQLAIHLHNTAECDSGLVSAPVSQASTEATFCSGRGTVVSGNVNPLNGDREILVTLSTTGTNPFADSAWQVELRGTVVAGGHFDAWVNGSESKARFTTNVDTTDTLNDLASAAAPVTVGSYNTKNSWYSLAGPMSAATTNPLGAIAYFSSSGPIRSCSAAASCPTVQKPEIAAPGAWIAAAFSGQTAWPADTCADCYLDLDGVHRYEQGTSMSAAIVTGAVALLLQVAPTADPPQIKEFLERYATVDDSVGQAPSSTWGYGKLNVKAAFDALPVPPPVPPVGLSATVSGSSAVLSWTPDTAIDIDGYNVYRGTSSGGELTQVATVGYESTDYTDSGLASGTYYYTVRALDTKGQESPSSTQVSAAITSTDIAANSTSGGGGCVSRPGGGFDPTLVALALLGALGLRQRGRRRMYPDSCDATAKGGAAEAVWIEPFLFALRPAGQPADAESQTTDPRLSRKTGCGPGEVR